MEDTYSTGLSDINTGRTDAATSSDLQNLHSSGDMKMDVDEEGTKTNDDSVDIRSADIPTGDNTAESFEQNLNTSQHNNYERNGTGSANGKGLIAPPPTAINKVKYAAGSGAGGSPGSAAPNI